MFGFKIIKASRLKQLQDHNEELKQLQDHNEELMEELRKIAAIPLENEGLLSQVAVLTDAHNALLAENKKLRRENAMLWHDNRELRGGRND